MRDSTMAVCKARAAGMASATRGRARTFDDLPVDDGGYGEILEGMEDYLRGKGKCPSEKGEERANG